MKRSQKQIEASRINGAKSRGPVTDEGRLSARRVSWRQHILARSVVLDGEARERFNELHQSRISELQPATPMEKLLVSRMAINPMASIALMEPRKSVIEAEPGSLPERASIFGTRYDHQFDRALATIERRRQAKSRVEPATRSKQTTVPPTPTQQPPTPDPSCEANQPELY